MSAVQIVLSINSLRTTLGLWSLNYGFWALLAVLRDYATRSLTFLNRCCIKSFIESWYLRFSYGLILVLLLLNLILNQLLLGQSLTDSVFTLGVRSLTLLFASRHVLIRVETCFETDFILFSSCIQRSFSQQILFCNDCTSIVKCWCSIRLVIRQGFL